MRPRRPLEERHHGRPGRIACSQGVKSGDRHRTVDADGDQHDDELHCATPASAVEHRIAYHTVWRCHTYGSAA